MKIEIEMDTRKAGTFLAYIIVIPVSFILSLISFVELFAGFLVDFYYYRTYGYEHYNQVNVNFPKLKKGAKRK